MKHERGQALILVALALVAMIGLTALAIDGGNAFAIRRQAQSASDAGALAAAYAGVKNNDTNAAALAAAAANGYAPNGNTTTVNLVTAVVPDADCPGDVGGMDYTVTIYTVANTWFGGIVGIPTVQNTVRATARRCNAYYSPFYWGNAVVGLNPGTSFLGNGSAGWDITGGGIFTNGDAYFSNNSCGQTTVPGLTTVGTISCLPPGAGQNTGVPAVNYPDDVLALQPPDPCVSGGIGKPDPYEGKNSNQMPATVTFDNGVYCIYDFDKFDKLNIVVNAGTLYIKDTSFTLNFSGSGGFSGTPSQSGPYAGYYLFVPLNPDKLCTSTSGHNDPTIVYTGNGLGRLVGTIFAPSACIDVRGNSANSVAIESQIIGYTVLSTGTSNFSVVYNSAVNAKKAVPPTIQLLK